MESEIVYLCPFDFTSAPQCARRVLYIGRALSEAGFGLRYLVNHGHVRMAEGLVDWTPPQEVAFHANPEPVHSERPRGIRNLLAGLQTSRWLRRQDLTRARAVILYCGLAGHTYHVWRACRAAKVPLVLDCAEWHREAFGARTLFDLDYWDCQLRMRVIHPRAGNLICVSSFLANYYSRLGARALRVPTLIDPSSRLWAVEHQLRQTEEHLRLVFSGSWHRDDLSTLLAGLGLARSRGVRARLEFLGATHEDLETVIAPLRHAIPDLDAAVAARGRIAAEDVPKCLRGASAGIVFHPRSRWANAGFPTKVPEYLALGIPVLYYPSGDLALYIRDGIEGIAVPEYSAEGLSLAIERLATLSAAEMGAMRRAARSRALECFDYRLYSDRLRAFMTGARS
jgi:glycosyltransferase involved in cell wall biosynthesis